MSLSMIALNKLTASTSNVRKTGGVSIDDLAANILANGLIQNLTVRPNDKGKFEVIAGGRRLAALRRLAKEKHILKTYPVSCRVLDAENDTEISLSENTIRQAMHPADQYEAFRELADRDHLSVADIAARFGSSEANVSKLLKLGRVSVVLLAAYRADTLDLEAMIAFAITDDHAHQEQVFHDLKKCHGLHARNIRRLLTDTKIETSDKRARFIGLAAYEEAGGTITRDLFAAPDEGYLDDTALLDRLVTERLEEAAAEFSVRGWKWVDLYPDDFPSLYEGIYRKAAIGSQPTPQEKASTGVVLGISHDGKLRVEKGVLRKGDRLPGDAKATKPKPIISASLLEDMTAHRSQALRAALANDNAVAFDALLYSLVLAEFAYPAETVADIRCRSAYLGERVEPTPAGEELARLRAHWETILPTNEASDLWNWIRAADQHTKDDLLSYLVALTIDVRQVRGNDANPHSHQLQQALGFDMADYWRPTAANYFQKIRREQVLEAMREGKVIAADETFSAAKKTELAMIAERLLGATRWLPKQFRLPKAESPAVMLQEERQAA